MIVTEHNSTVIYDVVIYDERNVVIVTEHNSTVII